MKRINGFVPRRPGMKTMCFCLECRRSFSVGGGILDILFKAKKRCPYCGSTRTTYDLIKY